MSALEIRQIEPSWANAARVAELTREVYANTGRYDRTDLDKIANPDDELYVLKVVDRLYSQDMPPLQQRYYGLHDHEGRVQGYSKWAVWDNEDQESFSGGVDDPLEYHSVVNGIENRVFGAHILALSGEASFGHGLRLFRHIIKDYPDSTIKAAVDERDTELREYVQRVWRMEDTGHVGAVALGSTGLAPMHRLFKTHVDSTGKISG